MAQKSDLPGEFLVVVCGGGGGGGRVDAPNRPFMKGVGLSLPPPHPQPHTLCIYSFEGLPDLNVIPGQLLAFLCAFFPFYTLT